MWNRRSARLWFPHVALSGIIRRACSANKTNKRQLEISVWALLRKEGILKTEDEENNTVFLMNCRIPSRGEAALELRSKMSLILDQLAFFCRCVCFFGGGCWYLVCWGTSSEREYKYPFFSPSYRRAHTQPGLSFVRTDSDTHAPKKQPSDRGFAAF